MEEWKRVQKATARAERDGKKLRCPLFTRRISNEEVKQIIREKWKICLPQPYLYLPHNNCIPCFKAGKSRWYQVWKHYPQQFQRAVEMEQKIGHTVFKDTDLPTLAKVWEQTKGQIDFGFEEGVPCMCAI